MGLLNPFYNISFINYLSIKFVSAESLGIIMHVEKLMLSKKSTSSDPFIHLIICESSH